MKRFLLPKNWDGRLKGSLEGEDFHYLCRVRRMKEGDLLVAQAHTGERFELQVMKIRAGSCDYLLTPSIVPEREILGTRITLIPCITKGRKIDTTIRQAVESGVSVIWPFASDHSLVRFKKESESISRRERWEKIIREAVQQSGQDERPSLDVPSSLNQVFQWWGNKGPLIFLHEKRLDGVGTSFHECLAESPENLAIISGPEGGLSQSEVKSLLDVGAVPVFLGESVLRAETAALYGIAAAMTVLREKDTWQPA